LIIRLVPVFNNILIMKMSKFVSKEEKRELKVSIVIPNYNGENLLLENLPYVIKAKDNSRNRVLEIIVVDDASTDQSVKIIKKKFPEIKLIKHTKNRGFSSSVNTGVRTSKGELIVLLNTDVVPKEDFLESALRHFENPGVFAVSLHEKGYGPARGVFKDGFIQHESMPESKKLENTFWVNGGSGIFRRDVFLRLGGMDEKLLNPFYWEDVDLSYRALKSGYRILWEPKARVLHQHELTIQKIPLKYRQRIQERNHLLFIWKDLTSKRLLKKHSVGVIKRVFRHPGYLRIVLMALFRIRGVIRARKRLKKIFKVSDEAIFAGFR